MVTCSIAPTCMEDDECLDADNLGTALDRPIDKKRWNNMVVVKRLSFAEQVAIEKQKRNELERVRSTLPPSRRALKRKIKTPAYVTPLNRKWRTVIKRQIKFLIPTMPPLVHSMLILRVSKLIELYQLDVVARANCSSATNKPKFQLSLAIACCIEAVEEANRMSQQLKIKKVESVAVTLARIISEFVTGEQLKPDLDRQLRNARYTKQKGITRL